LDGVDLILDGTDNFETRFLLNDAALCFGIPWVFGGCVGAEGQTLTILPGETPCLQCLLHDAPPPGTTPTCDTAGILGPIVNVIASIQACEALKILTGHREAINRTLLVVELWDTRVRQVKLDALREATDCPACRRQSFPWLEGQRGSHTAVLCGRNAVQLSYPDRPPIALDALARHLAPVGHVTCNRFLLRLEVDRYVITVFPDGRAIVGGTDDIAEARTAYATYIGA
jgi:adenylyltransferase/sulfurtransferase